MELLGAIGLFFSISFVVLLITNLFEDDDDATTGVEEKFYSDGKKRADVSWRHSRKKYLHGKLTSYDKNGKPDFEAEMENGTAHGFTKAYCEDGSLFSTTRYFCGKASGVAEFYDEKGELVMTVTYENGWVSSHRVLSKAGKLMWEQGHVPGLTLPLYSKTNLTVDNCDQLFPSED